MFIMLNYIIILKFYVIFHLIALTNSENVIDESVSDHKTQDIPNLNDFDSNNGQNKISHINPEKFDYPEKKLETLSHDLQSAAANNPYYKIPSYDYKIRKMSEEHESLFRTLGVYVIHNDKDDENGESDVDDMEDKESKLSENKGNNFYDMFDKSELLDAMTPEEKLHYIPKLKDAISHEIATQKDRLEKIRDKLISKSNMY